MPILNLQRKYREIGRIRLGDKSDNGAPHKLESFRLTSASRDVLDTLAAMYGGTVQEWKDAPNPGQFELYTNTDTIRVLVPPGETTSQWMEQWDRGGCKRRCDGITEILSDQPCMCPDDPDERHKLAQQGKACHITTRINVMLPDVPDIGVWRLESRGFYAATEIAGTMDVLSLATRQGVVLPAQLRLEQRSTKRGGAMFRYAVPVLELPDTTPRQLLAGLGVISGELPAGEASESAQAALPAPVQKAPETPPATATKPPDASVAPTKADLSNPETVAKGPQPRSQRAPAAASTPAAVTPDDITAQMHTVATQLGWTKEDAKAAMAKHPEIKSRAALLKWMRSLLPAANDPAKEVDDWESYEPPEDATA